MEIWQPCLKVTLLDIVLCWWMKIYCHLWKDEIQIATSTAATVKTFRYKCTLSPSFYLIEFIFAQIVAHWMWLIKRSIALNENEKENIRLTLIKLIVWLHYWTQNSHYCVSIQLDGYITLYIHTYITMDVTCAEHSMYYNIVLLVTKNYINSYLKFNAVTKPHIK